MKREGEGKEGREREEKITFSEVAQWVKVFAIKSVDQVPSLKPT